MSIPIPQFNTDVTTLLNDSQPLGSIAPSAVAGLFVELSSIVGSVATTPGPVGPQGPVGATGPIGNPGATGLQGPAGSIGLIGPVGNTGIQGTTGLTGNQGLQGIAGPTGIQGLTGNAGAAGIQGPSGSVGSAGPQGIQGLTGSTGSQGLTGGIGVTGASGLQGLQGLSGTAGTNGTNGTAGTNGTNGTNGNSLTTYNGIPPSGYGNNGDSATDYTTGLIYQKASGSWTQNGTLKGLTGSQGPIGQTGPIGTTGLTGPVGTTGLQGSQGLQGNVGSVGGTGLTGSTGPQGIQGIQGITGSTGGSGGVGLNFISGVGVPGSGLGNNLDSYLDRSTGLTYVKTSGTWVQSGSLLGPTGTTGVAGPTGSTGLAGSAGATGGSGAAGLNFISGTGVPGSTLGNNLDSYLDRSTGLLYIKNSGSWVQNGTVIGPQGVAGPAGSYTSGTATNQALVWNSTSYQPRQLDTGDITVTNPLQGSLSVGYQINAGSAITWDGNRSELYNDTVNGFSNLAFRTGYAFQLLNGIGGTRVFGATSLSVTAYPTFRANSGIVLIGDSVAATIGTLSFTGLNGTFTSLQAIDDGSASVGTYLNVKNTFFVRNLAATVNLLTVDQSGNGAFAGSGSFAGSISSHGTFKGTTGIGGNYTFLATDEVVATYAGTTAITVTIPSASANTNRIISVVRGPQSNSTGPLTITSLGGNVTDPSTGVASALSISMGSVGAAGSRCTWQSDGSRWVLLSSF